MELGLIGNNHKIYGRTYSQYFTLIKLKLEHNLSIRLHIIVCFSSRSKTLCVLGSTIYSSRTETNLEACSVKFGEFGLTINQKFEVSVYCFE